MTVYFVNISLRILFSSIIFLFFVFAPLKSRFRYGCLKTGLFASSIIIVSIAVTMFLRIYKESSKSIVLIIIFWIVYAVWIFHLTIKGSYFEGIFVVLVVLNLYANAVTLAKLIVSAANWNISPYTAQLAVAAGIFILYIPLLWVLMFKLYKPIIEFQIDFTAWRFIWVVPVLSYLIFYQKIIDDYWRKSVQITAGDVLFNILWSLSSYIFFCITLLLLIQSYKRIVAVEQTSLIGAQLKMQGEQYEQLLNNIEKTACIKHDWRHHLLTISGLAEAQKLEELQHYLEKLMPVYLKDGEYPICKNHVVNIILQHYAGMAEAQNINIQMNVDIPLEVNIPDMDLCIVFGNLVENAIEACKNQKVTNKFIDIRAGMKEKLLVIMIKNTYEKALMVKNNVYYSTKHEGTGIGLVSVRRVVEKNKGYMQLKHDNEYFCVSILLNSNISS